jgi:protein-S-isoprenylcysteine O-methyltransferase Ste14
MDVWFAKGAVLLATAAMIAIRAPHGHRSQKVEVARSAKGALETFLLVVAWLGFLVPLVWIATPALSFADYPLRAAVYVPGVALFAVSLWLFHRSHADLGTNWSITLQVRRGHRLVTEGVYRRVRHPMYLSLLLYSVAQALVLPNWVAGPSYLVAFGLLFALRLGPEERMMRTEFGPAWDEYASRTKRLVPGVW